MGLPWIESQLREDNGEIEASEQGVLPQLLSQSGIRGDLHVHTDFTDGSSSLEQMAEAARAIGYRYIAVTDHSKRIAMAHGLDERRLRIQMEMIDRLNQKFSDFTVLKGIEVDILEDGTLDLPNTVLKELDLAVCSIHSKFKLSSKEQTRRIIRAMDNRYFTIFAHPTGRLINRRDPCSYDFAAVFKTVAQRGCFLEVNSNPERLDVTDSMCRYAKSFGVRFAVSTDAHCTSDYKNILYGVNQARRGWVEAGEVVNTRGIVELLRMIGSLGG